jgi:hypothetical protein
MAPAMAAETGTVHRRMPPERRKEREKPAAPTAPAKAPAARVRAAAIEDGAPLTALFDLGHPAHFHLFKHSIAAMKKAGHRVHIIGRQKDCLPGLLDRTGWDYHLVRRPRKGLTLLAAEQFHVLGRILAMAAREPVDLMLGTSVVIGLASRLTGAASLVFCEDDQAVVPLFSQLAYAPAHMVITPRALEKEDHGRKHLTYPGYQELAYLHPNLYEPDPTVLDQLGVGAGEPYFIVRLVALRAHHDIGEQGLSHEQAREVVRRLLPHGRVFLSIEGDMPEDLRPYLLPTPVDRIFDVMSYAQMIVGDSQTMTIEAAVLGTPALRCNTFVGRLSVLEELEHRYGLTVGIRPQEFPRLLGQIDAWLSAENLKAVWRRRRDRLLAESVNLTDWTLDLVDTLARRRRRGREVARARPQLRGRPTREPMGLEPFGRDASQEKYATRNPVERWLIRDFFDDLEDLLAPAEGPILDAGAGEGDAHRFLSPAIREKGVTALEIDASYFPRMRRIAPNVTPVQGNLYDLPFKDAAFDTVMCLEVLEHLTSPEAAFRELLRVSRRGVVLSVPWEPVWRLGNLVAARYVWALGNTPGHIQHWTRRGFVSWVERFAQIAEVRRPTPWTMVLASPPKPTIQTAVREGRGVADRDFR